MKTLRTSFNDPDTGASICRKYPMAWLLVMTGVLLGSVLLSPRPSSAGVVVQGRIHTPNVDLRIGKAAHGGIRGGVVFGDRHRSRVYRPGIVVEHRPHRHLRRRDYRIAGRLSYLSGVREGRILRFRRLGWSWREIADHFDISRPMLRAARSQTAFERYLSRHRRRGYYGVRFGGHWWR